MQGRTGGTVGVNIKVGAVQSAGENKGNGRNEYKGRRSPECRGEQGEGPGLQKGKTEEASFG